MDTVKLWIYWNGLTKITLRKGKQVQLYSSEPTDEGYSYVAESFYLGDGLIIRESTSGGRDCDGPIDRFTEYECKLSEIKGGKYLADENIYLPSWVKQGSEINDYFARSMGY